MRALQIAIIVMGVLIIAGVIIVFYELGRRSFGEGDGAAQVAGRIELPAGVDLVGTDIDEGRLYITVALAGGGHRVLVYDAATGAPLGDLEIVR